MDDQIVITEAKECRGLRGLALVGWSPDRVFTTHTVLV